MKILVLGAGGMLGHKMFQTLREHFADVAGSVRGSTDDEFHRRIDLFQHGGVLDGLDVMDRSALASSLRSCRPEWLINCVGIIKQRPDKESPIPNITINALLPHQLRELCAEWGGRLIHFSTDCVFSGSRGNYTEGDLSDAEDLYGKSKFLGEVDGSNTLTLRTSIIGRELAQFRSLLEWFLAQKGRTIRGFTRASYSGVTTNVLARLVSSIIAKHPSLQGLYQVTSPTISKYDLLLRLREAYGLATEIVADDSFFCDRSMRGEKLRAAIGYTCPPWPELCAELAQDPTPYEKWR